MKEEVKTEQVKNAPSVGDVIWDDVRKTEISLYSLPPKLVENYCERLDIEPSKLYLRLGPPSLLTALEERFAKKYDVVMGKLYCEISRKSEV